MGRSAFYRAIVLRTVDTGEADRFCILFTREQGRLAAAARGARRQGSKLASTLQAGRILKVECTQGSSGCNVNSAVDLGETCLPVGMVREGSLQNFLEAQVCCELLLQLTEDGEALPELFDMLCTILRTPSVPSSRTMLLWKVCLLAELGLLPLTLQDDRFAALSLSARSWLEDVVEGRSGADAVPAGIAQFITAILQEHLRSPLKSERVRAEMAMH